VAAAATTIEGVSVLTEQLGNGGSPFELGLSNSGIEVRRPGQPVQHVSWDRVSAWSIEEREGYLVLTLRGPGAAALLAVPGWTRDGLEQVLRDVTSDEEATPRSGSTLADGPTSTATASTATPTATPRAERRTRRQRRMRLRWKAVVTVVLLCLLAAAVTVVLLQSAGLINWGFLGPTA
jgi:hypothetical protein